MANPATLYVKQATIAALKAAPAIAALVGPRVYPLQRPAMPVWPFVAFGVPLGVPFGASCLDGSQIEFAVHGYAVGEDVALGIAAAIEKALDGATIDLVAPFSATAHFVTTGGQIMQDGGEADKFHAFVSVRVTVSS